MCEEAGWLDNDGSSSLVYGDNKHDSYTEIGEVTWAGHQELERLRNGG